jgi:hypothetical protein
MRTKTPLETDQVIEAMAGAAQGIAAAVEQGTITPTQIQCLLDVLLSQLELSLHH